MALGANERLKAADDQVFDQANGLHNQDWNLKIPSLLTAADHYERGTLDFHVHCVIRDVGEICIVLNKLAGLGESPPYSTVLLGIFQPSTKWRRPAAVTGNLV